MDWYYAAEGKQNGPVSEEELSRLLRDGAIAPETLVWHAGMEEWRPYSAGREEASRYCSSCGRSFPISQLQFAGASALCASCRPQMAVTGVVYAGFWIRFLAYVIDGAIVGGIRGLIAVPLGLSFLDSGSFRSPLFWTHIGEMQISSFLIGICYFVFFWTQYGATPGKMLLKMKVTSPDGGPISLQQAVFRYFGQILSGLILGIGFIMAAFDDEKRALHDRLANTRVVFGEWRR